VRLLVAALSLGAGLASSLEAATQPAGGSDPIIVYEITATLDPEQHRLLGRERLDWTNASAEPIGELWFHLYWNAFKNEQSLMLRQERKERALGFGNSLHRLMDVEDGDWGWIDVIRIATAAGEDLTQRIDYGEDPGGDESVMRLRLPEPLAPGATVRLEIAFESKVPHNLRRSGRLGENYILTQWFPKPAVHERGRGWVAQRHYPYGEFYADFADFTVHLETPERFVVGATGREVARGPGSAAGTIRRTFVERRVHDFAWTADPRYLRIERRFDPAEHVSEHDYRHAAEVLGLEIEALRLAPVDMILLIQPEHVDLVERHFEGLTAAIAYYGLWYGPYPYDTVTMVDTRYHSNASGMEYPTFFMVGTGLFPRVANRSLEMLVAHEFGHNYWQGMCANNEFAEAWLDESLNEFSDGKFYEARYGRMIWEPRVAGLPLRRYTAGLRFDLWELYRRAVTGMPDPIAQPASESYSATSHYGNIYARGTVAFRTLERIVGDATMHRILRAFHARCRFRHPGGEDFIAVANEVSGRDLGWFFEQAFASTAVFDYGIADVASVKRLPARGVFDRDGRRATVTTADAEGAAEDGYDTWIRVRRYGDATLGGDARLTVRAEFESGEVETREWDGLARWTEFHFHGDTPLRHASVDPDEVLLLDADLTNNSRSIGHEPGGALRWGNRLLLAVQHALWLLPVLP
jgi:hypothetical protein